MITGIKLPTELCDILKKYTSAKDHKEISRATGMSEATVKGLLYHENKLTKKNYDVVRMLILISLKRIREAKKDEKIIKKYF